MPKKRENLKTPQILEVLNDSDSGDDVLGALDGDSDEEVEDIRGLAEDDGDEEVRFYNCDPPETTPGAEVLGWLANAPARRPQPQPQPPTLAEDGRPLFRPSSLLRSSGQVGVERGGDEGGRGGDEDNEDDETQEAEGSMGEEDMEVNL